MRSPTTAGNGPEERFMRDPRRQMDGNLLHRRHDDGIREDATTPARHNACESSEYRGDRKSVGGMIVPVPRFDFDARCLAATTGSYRTPG